MHVTQTTNIDDNDNSINNIKLQVYPGPKPVVQRVFVVFVVVEGESKRT
jgi:hypothetical protein